MKKLVVMAATAFTIASCVPMRMTYFEPVGDGQVVAAPCGGAPRTLRIKLPARVKADVDVVRSSSAVLRVSVNYYVPRDTSIRLVSGVTTVVDRRSGARQELAPASVTQQCGTKPEDIGCERNVPPTTPMDGASVEDGSLFGLSKADRGFFYRVDTPSTSKSVGVTPPEIEINGVLVHMKEIDFVEKTSTKWTGLCQ